MTFHVRTTIAVLALMTAAAAMPDAARAADAAGTLKIGGGYANPVPIPVNDGSVKEIAGALFKPEGTGPFPVVVYIPACGGPNFPLELQTEKRWIERLNGKGIAAFVVDPFVPRGLDQGNCDKVLTVRQDVQDKKEDVLKLLAQGGDDAVAAVKTAKGLPGIDPGKVFLMGASYGGTATLYATDPKSPRPSDTDLAGVVAYFPLCDGTAEAAVPTLVMIGDQDDWTGPVAACEALKGRGKFEVVVYPGATHAFTMPFDKPVEFAGHKMAYDEAATKDSADRALAFIEAHIN